MACWHYKQLSRSLLIIIKHCQSSLIISTHHVIISFTTHEPSFNDHVTIPLSHDKPLSTINDHLTTINEPLTITEPLSANHRTIINHHSTVTQLAHNHHQPSLNHHFTTTSPSLSHHLTIISPSFHTQPGTKAITGHRCAFLVFPAAQLRQLPRFIAA